MAAATATALVSDPPRPRVDVAGVVDPLKTRYDGNLSAVDGLEDLRPVDRLDTRLRECVVRQDLHLVPEKRSCLAALGLDGHGREGCTDLLPGRREGVHFAGLGDLRDFMSQSEQAVRLAAHRAYDEHDTMPRPLGGEGATRDVADAVNRPNGRAAELLND